jgi:HEAT repeat protein
MDKVVPNITELAEQFISTNEEIRRQAVLHLANYPLGVVREYLFGALGDESWRVRKEAVATLVHASGVDDSLIEDLIGLLHSHDNAGLRNSAVESLEKLGSRAVATLCHHVADADHDVRKFVIDVLGSIGDPVSVPLIIKALDDPDPNVRAAAAENLGKIAAVDALPQLLQALSINDMMLQFTILSAVASIGQPVPIERLSPFLQNRLLKKPIYDCLGDIGGIEAFPLLLDGLNESMKSAREAAAVAMSKIYDRLSAGPASQETEQLLSSLYGTSAVEGLLALGATTDRSLLEALVKILGLTGDERAAGFILRVCHNERLPAICVKAFRNMGKRGEDFLLDIFPSAEEDDRCFIAGLLGELDCNRCSDLLREGMKSDNQMLRLAATKSVGKIGLSGLISETAALLDDEIPEVRAAALSALCRFTETDQQAIAPICRTLAVSKLPEHRMNAAILLASLADGEKLSLLVKDENSMVRKAAVSSLARLSSTGNSDLLFMALMDEDPDVRIAAASALGEVERYDVLEPLLLALRDDDPWVQCAVLKSLAHLGNREALPAINDLLVSAEGPVLIAALGTIAQIGGDRGGVAIGRALESPDEEVVKAAMEILSHGDDTWIAEYRDKLLCHPHWDVRNNFVKIVANKLADKALPILCYALENESDSYVREQITELMNRLR